LKLGTAAAFKSDSIIEARLLIEATEFCVGLQAFARDKQQKGEI
jgi:hypothetical protein